MYFSSKIAISNLIRKIIKVVKPVNNDIIATIFYASLAIPLVYLPTRPFASRSLRITYIIVVVLAAVVFPVLRKKIIKNFNSLHFWVKAVLIAMLCLTIVSTLLSKLGPAILLFGREPEYMGVIAWVSLVPFGLLFADRLKELLFSYTSLMIFCFILMVSIGISFVPVVKGYRMVGLIMQATTMALYATVVAILSLELFLKAKTNQKVEKVLSTIGIGLSLITVILTQSRAGFLFLTLVYLYYALRNFKTRGSLTIGFVLIVMVLPLLPQLQSHYFSRFNNTSVSRGIQYRLNIYQVSGRDILRHNVVIGKGPSSLPIDLNNSDIAPEDIAKTLNEGLIFISSHDIFLDIAQYFGVLVSAGLLMFCIMAMLPHRSTHTDIKAMKLIFFILIGNGIINVFSPELTSMLIIVLMYLLVQKKSIKMPS